MAKNVRVLSVFVASPSDVEEERRTLDEVIERINRTTGKQLGVCFEIEKWEHMTPRIRGISAQREIDKQLSKYDVFVGIMSGKFGSPAGRSGSGTEHEFKAALKRVKQEGRPWILFYFDKEPAAPTDEQSYQQFGKVLAFKKKVFANGTAGSYRGVRGSEGSFFEQVDTHLRQILTALVSPPASSSQTPAFDSPNSPMAGDDSNAGIRTTQVIVQGNVINSTLTLGDGNAVEQHIAQEASTTAAAELPATLPTGYCCWLQEECADISLLGLPLKDGQAIRINHVYVPLTTTPRQESRQSPQGMRVEEDRFDLLLDRLGEKSLYLSGAAGSGKSTFCRWVAWLTCEGDMPRQNIPAPEGYQESFPAAFRDRLPVLVRFREFWHCLPTSPGCDNLTADQLMAAFKQWFDARPGGLSWGCFAAHLAQGSLLLILDGIDEIPVSTGEGTSECHPRGMLIGGLTAASGRWIDAGNRLLVTSRPYGVSAAAADRWPLEPAPISELSPPLQELLVRRARQARAGRADAARHRGPSGIVNAGGQPDVENGDVRDLRPGKTLASAQARIVRPYSRQCAEQSLSG